MRCANRTDPGLACGGELGSQLALTEIPLSSQSFQLREFRRPPHALSDHRYRSDPNSRDWPLSSFTTRSECGSRWPSAKHFTSWLCLSPSCKISGGKVLSARTQRTSNRATAHLRRAAVAVGRTHTALGAFYRRLAARIGKAKAVTATARKIAILFYNAMRYGL